jgi:hypothetical protein
MATVQFALYEAKDWGKKGDPINFGDASFTLVYKGGSSPLQGTRVQGNLWDVRDLYAGQEVAVHVSGHARKSVTVNTRPPIEVILSRS